MADLFSVIDALRNRTNKVAREHHRKFGKFVRIGPKTVSIADSAFIESIYGVRVNFPKVSHP